MAKEIVAGMLVDQTPSHLANLGSDWMFGNTSEEQLDAVFPVPESLGSRLRGAIARKLSPAIPAEERPIFEKQMEDAATGDGMVGVLVEHKVAERVGNHVVKTVSETEVSPKTARTVGRVLSRFAPEDERQEFKEEMSESKNWGEAMQVIKEHEVDTELALRANTMKKVAKVAVPVTIALVACGKLPQVDPNAIPQQDIYGLYFKTMSNEVIRNYAVLGATIGGVSAGVTGLFTYGKAVIAPGVNAEGHPNPPMALHAAAAKYLINVGLETFENGMKAGAATTGFAVFGGGVPVENVKTIGTFFSTGLAIQTVLEFITEPLNKVGAL